MAQSFLEGGWMMWPIVGLGLCAIAVAVRFAFAGDHRVLGSLRALSTCTILCGVFGTIIGWMRLLGAVQGVIERAPAASSASILEGPATVLLVVGGREALNCVAAALLFAALTTLLAAIGLKRFPRVEGAIAG